jgi:DNA polymerase III subunit epsilon
MFFDTETTGLVVDWNNPSNPANPRLVQLGYQIANEGGRALKTIAAIIKPEGFTIPIEASKIHGITHEMAVENGENRVDVIEQFKKDLSNCGLIVAHNYKFDRVVIGREMVPTAIQSFCTMIASTNICKIPKVNGYKWPKLSEAYRFFFEEELKNAHDALTDVLACKRVYFEGLMRGKVELPQQVEVIEHKEEAGATTPYRSIPTA